MTIYDSHPGDEDAGIGLRTSLAECVADVRMPTDLLDRAIAKNRKKAARNRLIGLASAAAAVAAAATVIVSTPTQSAGNRAPASSAAGPRTQNSAALPRVQTAAYVLRRAAAAEVNSYRLISVAYEPGSGTTYTDAATQQRRTVADLRDSAGDPYFQITDSVKNGVWTETDIDNQHHVWSVWNASANDHGAPVTISSFLRLQDKSDPVAAFRAALKQGIITVVGHQNLGGQDTILLHVRNRVLKLQKGIMPPPADEIWVDASTYLVVQTKSFVLGSFNKKTGAPVVYGTGHTPSMSDITTKWEPVTVHVSWLSPTPQNLAMLTVTPPSGYTKVPFSKMVQYLAVIS